MPRESMPSYDIKSRLPDNLNTIFRVPSSHYLLWNRVFFWGGRGAPKPTAGQLPLLPQTSVGQDGVVQKGCVPPPLTDLQNAERLANILDDAQARRTGNGST